MTYMGEDYDVNNTKSIQTDAGFYFSTYSKTSSESNVDLRVGVTKTPIPEILVVYAGFKNNNPEKYFVYQKDFEIKSDDTKTFLVTSSEYVNAFQSQETGNYAGMQQMAPTLSNIATISNNFQPTGQESLIYQQNTRDNLTGQLSDITSEIVKHALNTASIIEPNSEKYYYVFVKASEGSNLVINYKDLNYVFGTKTKTSEIE